MPECHIDKEVIRIEEGIDSAKCFPDGIITPAVIAKTSPIILVTAHFARATNGSKNIRD